MNRKILSAVFWGGLFILAGVLMLLNSLEIISFRIWDWWPVIFIIIGLQMVIDGIGKDS